MTADETHVSAVRDRLRRHPVSRGAHVPVPVRERTQGRPAAFGGRGRSRHGPAGPGAVGARPRPPADRQGAGVHREPVLLAAGRDRLGGRLLRDQGPEAADREGPLPDDVDSVRRVGGARRAVLPVHGHDDLQRHHGERRHVLSAPAGLAGRPAGRARPPIVEHPRALRSRPAAWIGCHGNQDRCLAIAGWRSPICARCVGLLAGYPLAVAALFAFGPPSLERTLVGAVLLLPAALDGGAQALSAYRSTSPRRLVTGVLAGIGQLELLGGITAGLLRAIHG